MRRTVNTAAVVAVLVTLVVGHAAAGSDVSEPGPVPAPAGAERPGAAPERTGVVERVDRSLTYLDGDHRLVFHYPGAGYVKVHLRRLDLLPGDHLTVADPAGREVHRYGVVPGPAAGAGRAGADGRSGGEVQWSPEGWPVDGAWAMSVTGDTAVVTLHRAVGAGEAGTGGEPGAVPAPGRDAGRGVTVDRVVHGSRPPAGADGGDRPRAESLCGDDDSEDAACYRSSHPVVYRNSRAVARILIDGVELCTAFRVGPRNRLLTNHHCLATDREARDTEVWFNYQCVRCYGWAVLPPTKVRGERVLATDPVLDFTLFTVDDFDRVSGYGHLELATRPAHAGQEIYIPQHPGGLPGRVALYSDLAGMGACLVTDPHVRGYAQDTDVAYYCDTDAGSSGSPVLSRDGHRVVALHHFGGCPNGGVRIDLIRPRIAGRL